MSIVYDHPIGYVIENTLLFVFYGCQATVSQDYCQKSVKIIYSCFIAFCFQNKIIRENCRLIVTYPIYQNPEINRATILHLWKFPVVFWWNDVLNAILCNFYIKLVKMGNQLVGVAPSQIYPVEHYLSDHVDLSFDQRYDKLIRIQNLRCLLCSNVTIYIKANFN